MAVARQRVGRIAVFVRELRQRRVVRAVLAYGAGVAVALQGTEMACTALALPDLAYRITVIASIAGFPLVAVLSWVYDLTAQGLRKAAEVTSGQGRRVPVGRYLQLVGTFTVAAVVVLATAGAVSHLRYPSSDDGRVGLAIFPLRVSGSVGEEWSAGVSDLLATALDGTPSLRIVDPWSLWRPLRPEASAAPRAPDTEEATALAEQAGAHRFLLGSVVASGPHLEVAFRLFRVGRSEPMDAFVVTATSDGMQELVRAAAVRVLARVWGPLRRPEIPAELDFDATRSPEALKAYLAAEEALRRGMVDSADAAIDRSLALDSTFVLALVRAAEIKSWARWMRGQAYRGLYELLERARPHEDELNPRSRLRLQAAQASVRTDGPGAIEAVRRILDLDPLDYGANRNLEYYYRMYGWQLTPPVYGSRAFAEQVVQMDSTQLPALVAREWWAISLGDTADARVQLARLSRVDTTAGLARGRIRGLRALLADPAAFEEALPTLASLPSADFVDVVRHLQVGNPSRYRRIVETAARTADAPNRRLALGLLLTLDVAQGWSTRVDSALDVATRDGGDAGNRAVIETHVIAADLAGVGDRASAGKAVAWLARYVPADSALAYFNERPVWWAGWLMGAWHAQVGDTAVARRWVDVIGTLPAGGTSKDYRGGLQADIEARLAVRRARPETAIALERTAMELWSIHTENDYASAPSPLMRLNLALLLQDAGQRPEAVALLSSLVPPTTWMGFLTGRADFELGRLAAREHDGEAAMLHLGRALALWAEGGPDVSAWVVQARAELDSMKARMR